MVNGDIVPVGKKAIEKKQQALCFRSSQVINNLISNSHSCHEDFYSEIIEAN